MKKTIFIIAMLAIVLTSFSQNDYDWRSKSNGQWNDVTTWESYYTGIGWFEASDHPDPWNSAGGPYPITITIRNGHHVEFLDMDDNPRFGTTGGQFSWLLVVEDGGQLDMGITGTGPETVTFTNDVNIAGTFTVPDGEAVNIKIAEGSGNPPNPNFSVTGTVTMQTP